MSKNTKLIIYSLIYILFMIIIRYTLSHAHGFLIDHCLMIFLAIAALLGYFHGFIFKFNFTIVFVAIFMMLFIGQMTPPSRGFIEYSFIDFYYVSAATIFMLVADIAGLNRNQLNHQVFCLMVFEILVQIALMWKNK